MEHSNESVSRDQPLSSPCLDKSPFPGKAFGDSPDTCYGIALLMYLLFACKDAQGFMDELRPKIKKILEANHPGE